MRSEISHQMDPKNEMRIILIDSIIKKKIRIQKNDSKIKNLPYSSQICLANAFERFIFLFIHEIEKILYTTNKSSVNLKYACILKFKEIYYIRH